MDFLPKDPAILEIRKAERHDVPLLLEFIKGIARYAKMEDEVIASPDVLEREMFDEHRAEAVFAVVDGRAASRSTSTTSQHSSDIQDCILKTCLSGRKIEAKATERPCYCIWPR